MKLKDMHRIDAHNHVVGKDGKLDQDNARQRIEAADCLGIDRMCVSRPVLTDIATPEDVKRANDIVLEAMAFSDRFLGFCYVNPGYARESVAEIERCVEKHGMVGIKLYYQYFICDPALQPVMEYAAELKIPVLMHAGKSTDANSIPSQPRLSGADHFVEAAKMFPDTIMIQGHIGGGGDWEWNLRVLEERPNIYIDTSGSVIDAGIVEKTVATLGIDRVLFATDGVYEEGVGKILDANLNPEDKAKIFAGNIKRIFAQKKSPNSLI